MRQFGLLNGRLVSLLQNVGGAALLEFAVSLPLLVVFVVGIFDFSGAFNQKQKIEQAAQEGAIIAGAQPLGDIASPTAPDSLQPVVTAVYNSLVASGVLRNGTCVLPATATLLNGVKWQYKISGCPGDLIVTINRGWVPGSGAVPGQSSPRSIGTTVQVSYPYIWRFNSVIQLLIPGANYNFDALSENATVHNQM